MPFFRLNHLVQAMAFFVAAGLMSPCLADVMNGFQEYKGICDASAAVSVIQGSNDYFIVGDDEKNHIFLYQVGYPEPVSVLKLDNDRDHGEMDIEGAVTIGKYHLWIGSHGRDKNGEIAESRGVFFATVFENGKLRRVGSSYRNLVDDMVNSPAMSGLSILDGLETSGNSPEGFNIEGIAGNKNQLLIGLRGPLVDDKAVVMFVDNPLDVAMNGVKADFSGFELLDLEGRGVRDIVFDPDSGKYLIIAGPVTDALGFALYDWSPGGKARKLRDISGDFTPEALFFSAKQISPGLDAKSKIIHMISDDGSLNEDETRCNKRPETKQRFRMMDIQLDGL